VSVVPTGPNGGGCAISNDVALSGNQFIGVTCEDKAGTRVDSGFQLQYSARQ
jgi:hypothetical protein